MRDYPPEDLLDHRGRLNRLVLALVAGIAVGAVAYFVTDSLAGADYARGDRGAGRFIFGLTGVAFAGAFALVHWLLRRRDLKKWHAARIPKATVQ
ncbi:MAG: hypothetical protein K8W52_18480 [Deltaproteobacteria bacterium]|nr:hypothetical protein [Deltaproteobacteria bacterium]